MSNKDNFGGGFILGTIFGGIVGGIIGTLLANKNRAYFQDDIDKNNLKNIKYKISNNEQIIESKVDLEDKINQLNHAIDEVRFTLLKNNETELQEK